MSSQVEKDKEQNTVKAERARPTRVERKGRGKKKERGLPVKLDDGQDGKGCNANTKGKKKKAK